MCALRFAFGLGIVPIRAHEGVAVLCKGGSCFVFSEVQLVHKPVLVWCAASREIGVQARVCVRIILRVLHQSSRPEFSPSLLRIQTLLHSPPLQRHGAAADVLHWSEGGRREGAGERHAGQARRGHHQDLGSPQGQRHVPHHHGTLLLCLPRPLLSCAHGAISALGFGTRSAAEIRCSPCHCSQMLLRLRQNYPCIRRVAFCSHAVLL